MSVTGAHHRVQERPPAGPAGVFRVLCGLLVLSLAGCSADAPVNPVNWWHDLEGGPIAEARPPPPNADAPYPNLASVPKRPDLSDAATRTTIASRLTTDLANAEYQAAQQPLTKVPPTAAPPPQPAAPASADAQPMGATLATASAPPPPAQPIAAPQPAEPQAAIPSAPFPLMPVQPPPPPNLAGVPAFTRPTPPPVAPPPAPAVTPVATAAVSVPFSNGSAALAASAQAALRQLALRHGTAPIAVTGYGDAASSEPADQAAALTLAWARAQAMAGALQGDGVSPGLLRITGEAGGRGGVAAVTP